MCGEGGATVLVGHVFVGLSSVALGVREGNGDRRRRSGERR